MPITRVMCSPARLSRSGRMSGMPPATDASKSRSTPAAAAASNSSLPTLASSSLLPVTTGLPSLSASRIKRARRFDAADQLDDDVDVGRLHHRFGVVREHAVGELDRPLAREVAHRDLGHLDAQPRTAPDDVGVLREQRDHRRADIAAAEQADPYDVRSWSIHGTVSRMRDAGVIGESGRPNGQRRWAWQPVRPDLPIVAPSTGVRGNAGGRPDAACRAARHDAWWRTRRR